MCRRSRDGPGAVTFGLLLQVVGKAGAKGPARHVLAACRSPPGTPSPERLSACHSGEIGFGKGLHWISIGLTEVPTQLGHSARQFRALKEPAEQLEGRLNRVRRRLLEDGQHLLQRPVRALHLVQESRRPGEQFVARGMAADLNIH